MVFLKEPHLSRPVDCPYIDGEKFIQECFYAYRLNEREFDEFLASGWRRFGLFFFRPACGTCRKCLPIRVLCSQFQPSKSQRRVLRKNERTEVRISPPEYRDEIFEIYRKHSRIKFGQDSDQAHFHESFFTPAVPSVQSEYYIDGKLMAVGFLDISLNALSSVYFIYDPEYSAWSPGTFSVMKEMEIGRDLGMSYYNLGYWVRENSHMAYKGNFHPFETYEWEKKVWKPNSPEVSEETENVPQEKDIESQKDDPLEAEDFFI